MFAALAPYKLMIEIGVVAALLFAITVGVHQFLSHEQQIGYDRAVAEYNQKLIEAQKAAAEKEKQYAAQLAAANAAAIQREQSIRAASTAAATASTGLRDALGAIRNGMPSADADALRKSVTALAAVSGECADRYRGVAEKADRHASDVKTLIQAWPK